MDLTVKEQAQCACGKYTGLRYAGLKCDKCGTEVPSSDPRSAKEQALLDILRQIPYGQVTIFMQNGKPERVVKTEESIKVLSK